MLWKIIWILGSKLPVGSDVGSTSDVTSSVTVS